MSTLIINGTILTSSDMFKGDLGIIDGKISELGPDLDSSNYEEVIDARGKYILAGFIDPHVHLRLPMRGTFSADDFETGTRAAAAGGVTTLIDFATQMGDQSLIEAIKLRREEADGNVHVDYGLHGGITNWSGVKEELETVTVAGITSFKMFMAYKERGLYSSDQDILEALEYSRKFKSMIMVHAESEEILKPLVEKYSQPSELDKHGIRAHILSRPNIVETDAVKRAIDLAGETGGHLYIVHMSTGRAAELVREGRENGISVIGETCPQYLMFDDQIFKTSKGHFYATAPQIKSKQDQNILWDELGLGGVQVIGTDSCTFTKEQKNSWGGDFTRIPLGLPGTELMASLLHSKGVLQGRISLFQFVDLLSTHSAKIFGIYPDKGSLEVGTDADVVIFDPHKKFKVDHRLLETNADWSPYQDWELTGFPVMTFLRGKLVAQNGKCVGEKGFGNFLHRDQSGAYI